MIFAGVDSGSRSVKAVLLDGLGMRVIDSGVVDQGVGHQAIASQLLASLLERQGLSAKDVGGVVATGYARESVIEADVAVTEITCHARGVHHLHGDARTVIEIGGQDSKVLHLEPDGTVRDFVMNDRCAAGTGRFLELVARRLGKDIHELDGLSALDVKPLPISSTCVVFAETEIIGLLAGGAGTDEILAGVQKAIASRITSMSGRLRKAVVFTGGVAMVANMSHMLSRALGVEVVVPPQPQLTGALGAAIIAASAR